MKQLSQNSTVRFWCFSGLMGMTLMAGVVLTDSQARTLSPPSVSTIQTNPLASTEPAPMDTPTQLRSRSTQQIKDSAKQEQVSRNATGKKRMGLGMFVLGIVAEKS